MLPVSELAPEPPPIYEPPQPDPSFWYGVWIAIKLQLIPIIVILPAAIAGIGLHRKLHEHPAVVLIGSVVASAWVIRSYCRESGVSVMDLAGPLLFPPKLLLTLAAGVLGLLLLEIPLALLLMVRFPFLDPKLDFGVNQSPFAAFLLIVIAAPLTEEIIYRGILLRGFAPRYGVLRAAIAAGAIFSLSHVFPIRLPSMFIVGFLLSCVFLRLGSIWPGVLAHAFNNATAFFFMLKQPQPTPPQALEQIGPWATPCILAGAVLLATAILAARRVLSNQPRLAVP